MIRGASGPAFEEASGILAVSLRYDTPQDRRARLDLERQRLARRARAERDRGQEVSYTLRVSALLNALAYEHAEEVGLHACEA